MGQQSLKNIIKFEELDILENKLKIIFEEKDNLLFDKYSRLVSSLAIGSINITSPVMLISVCNLYIEEFEERRKIITLQLENIFSVSNSFAPIEKVKDKCALFLQRELRKLVESMGSKPQFEYIRNSKSYRLNEIERLLSEFDKQKHQMYICIEGLLD